MAENTTISWARHTANLWWGCQEVHAGCDNCYARVWAQRWGKSVWGPVSRQVVKSVWADLARFQREAAEVGEVHRVFVGSMMDIFEKPHPLVDAQGLGLPGDTGELRTRFFTEVVPASPNLQFLLLSKRPGNIKKYVPASWLSTPPKNVLYGYTAVDEASLRDMAKLLAVPGRHFASLEPLLAPLDLTPYLGAGGLEWVIVGGESGVSRCGQRPTQPLHPQWARDLLRQCQRAGATFHFKQYGEYRPVLEAEPVQAGDRWLRLDGHLMATPQLAPAVRVRRVGTKLAGHLLDEQLYQGVPAS
jgi:protein gp37